MFHGSMVALVTPMHESEEIDRVTLRELIEWHIESKTHAIIVAGTTGESGTLTNQEKIDICTQAVEQTKGRIPVIAGISVNSTKQTIELTRAAMEVGVDACLLMTPAYIRPTQEGLYDHYKAIAEAVAIPQIIYNVPSRTACDLLPATIQRLSRISNIIGIKEASGHLGRVQEILNLCGDSLDVFSGEDKFAIDHMLAGGKGVISVAANIVPQLMGQMAEGILAGREADARCINDKLLPLYEALFLESSPIPCKWALHEMGKIPPGIRSPLISLSEPHQFQVRNALQLLGLISM